MLAHSVKSSKTFFVEEQLAKCTVLSECLFATRGHFGRQCSIFV